jgi:steroid delta-isomerase
MSTESTPKAVSDYFAAIRAMDVNSWLATFADDAVSQDPVGAPPMKGHAALRQFFEGIAGAFEKVGIFEDNVFTVGTEVAVKWTGRGTGKNGRDVTFEGIDIFELNDAGKIQTLRAYWQPATMMAQLQS